MSDEFEFAVPTKRPRRTVALDEDEEGPALLHVSSAVRLRFTTSSPAGIFECAPKFTHQIFEDGDMVASSVRVTLNIDTMTLATTVDVQGCESSQRDELLQKLSKGVPDSLQEIVNEPPGELLDRYELETEVYEIRLCKHTHAHAHTLQKRAERLAVWFIEAADGIDFCSDSWEMIAVYQIIGSSFRFIGYVTLFTFQNPFKGARVRVCQTLVMPYAQHRGHGMKLLKEVYKLVHTRTHVTQITVEDPSTDFARLRDTIDTHLCLSEGAFDNIIPMLRVLPKLPSFLAASDAPSELPPNLDHNPDAVAVELPKLSNQQKQVISEKLKLTTSQVAICFDVCLYLCLKKLRAADEIFAKYRLQVKGRLYKSDPNLEGATKDVRVSALNDMYDRHIHTCNSIIQYVHRLEVI